MRTCSKTQKYSIAHHFFNFDRNTGVLHLKLIVLKRGIQLNKNVLHLTYPVLTTTQNDIKIAHFGFQFFSHHFYMGILYMEIWVQMRWLYLNRPLKIGMRTCIKTQKYSIAHNFFNFDHNIGMLHFKSIILQRGIQLNKNFVHLTYSVLTTTYNDEKLHILDSSPLIIISIWANYRWRDW